MSRWITLLVLSSWALAAAGQPGEVRQRELLHLLQQDCGSCHGLTLRGGLGPSLLPDSLAGKPAVFLVGTILDGRPGTAMPPWRPLISEVDASWLVQRLLDGEGVQ
jgi:cytochrome c55X